MTLPVGELQVVTESSGSVDLAGADGPEGGIRGRSLGQIAWARLRKDKIAMAGGVVVLILILVAIFAHPITAAYGYGPTTGDINLTSPDTNMPIGSLGGASSEHWLGVTPTDGIDIFAQLIYGARTSLIIGSLATLLSLIFGVICGVSAGFFRGWTDSTISRGMDLLLSFPTLLFSIAVLSIFGSVNSFLGLSGQALRYLVIIFVLGFFGFPYIGRIVRGQVLSLREKEFVDAARSLGASNYRIMTRELLPNLIGPILVYTTLTLPNYILGEAGLSYLGVGIQPPGVSWGSMLSNAGNTFQVDPMYLVWPGLALFITVLAFNLFGDGLRDALDPKSTQ
jgi:peptide/nickel transport system permease protein